MGEREEEACRVRDAMLAFDPHWLGRLADDPSIGPSRRRFAAAWRDVVCGDWDGAAGQAEAIEQEARREGDAALVVESAALRAFAAAAGDDLENANNLARRASRMGRTEALFEPECLAHLVLARVRRITGYPHLAMRILRTLWSRTPSRFYAWLSWELWMSGAREEGLLLPGGDAPFHRMTGEMDALLAAADRGDGASYRQLAAALEQTSAAQPLFGPEVRALLDANDPLRTPTDLEVARWCAGDVDEAPSLLHGILTRDGAAPADGSAIAFVFVWPGGRARRMTRMARGMLHPEAAYVLPQSRRKQGRNETILAALALAGAAGLSEADLFKTAYEFAYIPETHGGAFGVALHRARKYLGEHGEIIHERGQVRLEVRAPLLIPDPRCKKPIQDKLLCAIADRRGASTKDVAQAVGVSLRVAQATLAQLSADGSCLARKDGRELVYVVEDTTFSEPTRLRQPIPLENSSSEG